ncbi:MAG TPA: hypothetical protein DEQ43_11935, partial [Nocardioides bacterium]|nr:hypothetical protein [Nocardioides sp.]
MRRPREPIFAVSQPQHAGIGMTKREVDLVGNPWLHTTTDRLRLDLPTAADVDDLHAIHADPESWRHFPVGRHTSRDQSVEMVAQSEKQFAQHGL